MWFVIKIKKKNLFLNIENNIFNNNLQFSDFKIIIKEKNLIEVVYLKNNNLNFLFNYLIKNNVIINNVVSKNFGLEELFINLVSND